MKFQTSYASILDSLQSFREPKYHVYHKMKKPHPSKTPNHSLSLLPAASLSRLCGEFSFISLSTLAIEENIIMKFSKVLKWDPQRVSPGRWRPQKIELIDVDSQNQASYSNICYEYYSPHQHAIESFPDHGSNS
ncbi:hypothetical protein H5410_026474 [Solanum commersonii]|uniref:Uncharacterized protein n=1 Tax=Solanum commersonii TaxID=4109 RepID=A0A9J5Z1N0_SOLCO|nr:hypothetical protein H5410_026474 [Solanum commersonii]